MILTFMELEISQIFKSLMVGTIVIPYNLFLFRIIIGMVNFILG